MEWFSQKTSIAGVQIPNWGIALGAVIVILLIYTSMHWAGPVSEPDTKDRKSPAPEPDTTKSDDRQL